MITGNSESEVLDQKFTSVEYDIHAGMRGYAVLEDITEYKTDREINLLGSYKARYSAQSVYTSI